MAKNGPLEFCTVLYSNYDEKLGNHEIKTLRELDCAVTCSIRCILVWPQWWSFADVSQQGVDFSKKKVK